LPLSSSSSPSFSLLMFPLAHNCRHWHKKNLGSKKLPRRSLRWRSCRTAASPDDVLEEKSPPAPILTISGRDLGFL
ncbi:hypothetical protein PanWU01x14_037660, partial [Parasponia andersonii]